MRILALLDKPSRRSFGMVPFAAKYGDENTHLAGFDGKFKGMPIHQEYLHRLIRGGHALDVSSANANVSDLIISPIAGWLGKGFEEFIKALSAPAHTAPEERFSVDDLGSFWIASSEEVYGCLLCWTRETAKRAICEGNAPLADLMNWVLPDALETNAAIWRTRATKKEREVFVARQLRLLPGRTSLDLRAEYSRTINRILGK